MDEATNETEATRSRSSSLHRKPRDPRTTSIYRARELRLWGGHGRGAECDECHRRIEASQTDFEVEAELDGLQVILHFHRECYDSWKASQNAIISLHQLPQGA